MGKGQGKSLAKGVRLNLMNVLGHGCTHTLSEEYKSVARVLLEGHHVVAAG